MNPIVPTIQRFSEAIAIKLRNPDEHTSSAPPSQRAERRSDLHTTSPSPPQPQRGERRIQQIAARTILTTPRPSPEQTGSGSVSETPSSSSEST